MNFSKVFRRETTPSSILDEEAKAKLVLKQEEALREQELANRRNEWLKLPLTITLLNHLTKHYTDLIDQAENLSVAGDKDKATRLLIEARTTKNIITYARTHKYYGTGTNSDTSA